jgi:hypothetical protein
MKLAHLPLLLPAVIVCSVGSATAGSDDQGFYQYAYSHRRVHSKWDEQPRSVHVLAAPFIYLGRACDTFLHGPQIFAETIMGDRALRNKRGILAPREIPSEDRIISPTD